MKSGRAILLIAFIISLATLITWRATGGDYYTKFQRIEWVKVRIDPNDPLAQAGFYNDSLMMKTVSKNEFRLGLLPTPDRLFDRHIISVLSIIIPTWILAVISIWRRKRRNRIESE